MTLFEYPNNAFFGRVLPKSKIYEYAGPTSKMKEFFVRQVDQIVWKYKLAPETINIPATKAVSEIQVFHVSLRGRELKEDVLRAIDKAIPFPIIYELGAGNETSMIAAYKRPSEADAGKWIVGSYFTSAWIPNTKPRQALPIALDLDALYGELLKTLLPYPARPKETLPELLQRTETIQARKVELGKAEAMLYREKQFNRKVELNARIRMMKQNIEKLISSEGEE